MTDYEPRFTVVTGRDDASLLEQTQKRIGAEWPEFMLHDPAADYLTDCYEKLPEYQFALLNPDSEDAVAIGNSIPLRFDGAPEDLPEDGWDWAITKGIEDLAAGRTPNLLCALQVVVFGENRGRAISTVAVRAMKDIGRKRGLTAMIAPVRPSRKCDHPDISIDEYITWRRDDGLPFDPWLRVHARLGATIIKPCHTAMRIIGTVSEWERWTGLEFPDSGEYIVPGALTRVTVDLAGNRGTYIEPNVWMQHLLR